MRTLSSTLCRTSATSRPHRRRIGWALPPRDCAIWGANRIHQRRYGCHRVSRGANGHSNARANLGTPPIQSRRRFFVQTTLPDVANHAHDDCPRAIGFRQSALQLLSEGVLSRPVAACGLLAYDHHCTCGLAVPLRNNLQHVFPYVGFLSGLVLRLLIRGRGLLDRGGAGGLEWVWGWPWFVGVFLFGWWWFVVLWLLGGWLPSRRPG